MINIYGFKINEVSLAIPFYFFIFNIITELTSLRYSIRFLIEIILVSVIFLALFIDIYSILFFILTITLCIFCVKCINKYWINIIIRLSGNFLFKRISCSIYSVVIVSALFQIIILIKLNLSDVFYIVINSIIINVLIMTLLNIPHNLILRFMIQTSIQNKNERFSNNIFNDIIKFSELKTKK